jgi:hypothetical protein
MISTLTSGFVAFARCSMTFTVEPTGRWDPIREGIPDHSSRQGNRIPRAAATSSARS